MDLSTDSINKQILQLIDDKVEKLIDALQKQDPSFDRKEALELWCRYSGSFTITESKEVKCMHRMVSGPNVLKLCGKPVTKRSKTGTFCIFHVKYEK